MKIIVAVYDSKAEAYGPPIPSLTKGEAIRGFESECGSPESKLNKFKTDFSLWQIGEYDERTGEIKGLAQKINLANAWEVSQDKQNQQGAEQWPNGNQEPRTVSKTPQASVSTGQPLKQSTRTRLPSQPRI